MNLLIRNPDVETKQKQSLKILIPYFNRIDEIDPYKIQWSRLTYHRNNATYEMLLNICYLIINGLLMTEEKGTKKLAKYLDDQRMSRLLRNLYSIITVNIIQNFIPVPPLSSGTQIMVTQNFYLR